jgi:soluble cytochrome b562
MKNILLLLALFLCIISPLRAQDADSPLEGQMKILARGMRTLGNQVGDPTKQQENISLLESLKKAATDSKSLDPRKTQEIPDAKRAAFLADYRTDLDELNDALNQIEDAVKSGQYDKAKTLIGNVNTIKKEGHGKFKID